MKIEVTNEELERMASSAIADIHQETDEEFADGLDRTAGRWTSAALQKKRAKVDARFQRAIELVRAWEEAKD